MLSTVTWLNTAVQVLAASTIGAPAVPRHVAQPLGARNHIVVSAQYFAPSADAVLIVADHEWSDRGLTQPIITQAVAGPKTTIRPTSTRRASVVPRAQQARGTQASELHAGSGELAAAQIAQEPHKGLKAAQTMTPATPKPSTKPGPTSARKEAETLAVQPLAREEVKPPTSVTGAAPIPVQSEPADDGSSYIFGPST